VPVGEGVLGTGVGIGAAIGVGTGTGVGGGGVVTGGRPRPGKIQFARLRAIQVPEEVSITHVYFA